MVEQDARLDLIFGSLADGTRRDILRRVAAQELSVGQIAGAYEMSFAAVSKHLAVLERARLITKRREGRLQVAALSPATLSEASDHLERWRGIWEGRLDRLEAYLERQK
ncbi:MAG TPA: metalloregulator ArsR/SmtB family transcription factor [Caulobacteraceae bacterium]|jgi:DNA-binding transcriptional ArsR family regulator|nr:metalloregulator ArsR/SmtB family transcription factor [Caulobacteraceae bacterium]